MEVTFSDDGEGRGVALERSVIQHPSGDTWDVINAHWSPDGNALNWVEQYRRDGRTLKTTSGAC